MKQITIAATLGVLVLTLPGCGASGGSQGQSTASASTDGAGGSCSHPFASDQGVRACTYPAGLSAISYPDVNQYYWHPAARYFAVAETFYKPSAPGRDAGAWTGRTISVGDSCVIDDTWLPSVSTAPSNCMDSRTGNYRGATAEEQRSVLKFWQVMTRYVASGSR